jgi:hypothetical protein
MTRPKKAGEKGLKTEELMRAYFLHAGFFVVRGVPFQANGDDLTDIDLWVYERSATLSRRRTVIDIKDKKKGSQPAERLFFVKGLSECLGVEGAGVVTTDSRPGLRAIALKHHVTWIDGNDLKRLKSSDTILFPGRLSDEDLGSEISIADSARGSKFFQEGLFAIKSSIANRFGPACANSALESGGTFAHEAIKTHPNTPSAIVAGRLTYFASAIAAVALDFTSVDTALRPASEREKYFTDVIRYGSAIEETKERLLWAEMAVREYLPNGPSLAQTIKGRFEAETQAVPAEGLAGVVSQMSKHDSLFLAAKQLEMAAYSVKLPTFDQLPTEGKSFLGAVLDFVDADREKFAKSWNPVSGSDLAVSSVVRDKKKDESPNSENSKLEFKDTLL